MLQRLFLLLVLIALAVTAVATAAPERTNLDWKVQAGNRFQRAGEYVVRLDNKRLQDAIKAYGKPTGCRVLDSSSHVAATWADRGILIDARTYGGLPVDEDGCMSPDLIWVSDIRLTGRRWVTSFGLRVGDPTTKLRRLYPQAPYLGWERRNEYYLVWRHGRCVFGCSANDLKFGVDYPRLTAQVKNGRVVAFWLPVGGEGE